MKKTFRKYTILSAVLICGITTSSSARDGYDAMSQQDNGFDVAGRYMSLCAKYCGQSYTQQAPEMRDYLTCTDGTMKPANSEPNRTGCDSYNNGAWAGERSGVWCVKIHTDIHEMGWDQPVQCQGLIPKDSTPSSTTSSHPGMLK